MTEKLPGHVRRRLRTLHSKAVTPDDWRVLRELAKSYKTNDVAQRLRRGGIRQQVERALSVVRDYGTKKRLERALQRANEVTG